MDKPAMLTCQTCRHFRQHYVKRGRSYWTISAAIVCTRVSKSANAKRRHVCIIKSAPMRRTALCNWVKRHRKDTAFTRKP